MLDCFKKLQIPRFEHEEIIRSVCVRCLNGGDFRASWSPSLSPHFGEILWGVLGNRKRLLIPLDWELMDVIAGALKSDTREMTANPWISAIQVCFSAVINMCELHSFFRR